MDKETNMEEPARYISIAAYFNINGIKVAEHKPELTLVEQMNYYSEQYRLSWNKINELLKINEWKN